MTSRGFSTEAARKVFRSRRLRQRVAPLSVGIDAIEAGIARRSRRVVAPRWVGLLLPIRAVVQRVVEAGVPRDLESVLETARAENAPFTTGQPR